MLYLKSWVNRLQLAGSSCWCSCFVLVRIVQSWWACWYALIQVQCLNKNHSQVQYFTWHSKFMSGKYSLDFCWRLSRTVKIMGFRFREKCYTARQRRAWGMKDMKSKPFLFLPAGSAKSKYPTERLLVGIFKVSRFCLQKGRGKGKLHNLPPGGRHLPLITPEEMHPDWSCMEQCSLIQR